MLTRLSLSGFNLKQGQKQTAICIVELLNIYNNKKISKRKGKLNTVHTKL